MERQLDFTYDKTTFKGLPEFVNSIKKDGLKYIIILVRYSRMNETSKRSVKLYIFLMKLVLPFPYLKDIDWRIRRSKQSLS